MPLMLRLRTRTEDLKFNRINGARFIEIIPILIFRPTVVPFVPPTTIATHDARRRQTRPPPLN